MIPMYWIRVLFYYIILQVESLPMLKLICLLSVLTDLLPTSVTIQLVYLTKEARYEPCYEPTLFGIKLDWTDKLTIDLIHPKK